jgi:hypothetical protein
LCSTSRLAIANHASAASIDPTLREHSNELG